MTHFDIIIVGAGIAGASIASEIASDRTVLILEAEDQPGYHSTGRSAAFWTETYGGPQVQPLTTASRQFLDAPPVDFSDTGFLKRRCAINIARKGEQHHIDQFLEQFTGSGVAMEHWDRTRLHREVANLKPDWDQAIFEPECCDIDVSGLHMAYLKSARANGARLECRAGVNRLVYGNDIWQVEANGCYYTSPIVINAAGAWADDIASMAGAKPLDIQPMQRTMIQLRTEPPSSPDSPLIVALDGSFYFKPEAGGSYWLSPHDETPVIAGDAAPEELDVAIAIDRFQSVVETQSISVTRKWAGLRSFAPDRLPVFGFDPQLSGFFWHAGQGGFGIQTAPATAKLVKSILLDTQPEDCVSGIDRTLYDPARFS